LNAAVLLPYPKEFAVVFSLGYGRDPFPQSTDLFEILLRKIKEGGFNTVLCSPTEKRTEACRRNGIKVMVDLLAPEHHVYKNP